MVEIVFSLVLMLVFYLFSFYEKKYKKNEK
jgi:hypothetical protein